MTRTHTDNERTVAPNAGVTVPAWPMNDTTPAKKRRNVLLFWVHIVLVAVILGGFVYSVMNK